MADKNEAMENLFKAIDIITSERLSNLGYDKTIKATIIDDSSADKGKYIVSDGSSSFEAYAADVMYKKDMTVYVIIPEGDYNNQKLIVGKYSNQGDDFYNYANPSEDFLDVTHNLLLDVSSGDLVANYPDEKFVRLWSCNNVEYKDYSRLALKGNFRTWLSPLDVVSGTYGLVLYVVSREAYYEDEDRFFERTHRFDLMTSDMYGDPFNFETYYLQEKVFDISGLSNIVSMELLLVQNCDFKNTEGDYVNYDIDNPNIFVDAPYVSLGYDLNDVSEDEVRLYTFDSEEYDATYDTDKIEKMMEVRWVHIQEDGSVVAIDKEDEIPDNAIIHWYKYVLDRTISDKLAGALWQEIEEAQNCFSYSFVPDILAANEKFKVIIECPSRKSVAERLLESEFTDFTGIEIEVELPGDTEESMKNRTDLQILQMAINSYSRNDLLSFQEYREAIEEYNAAFKVQYGRDYDNYEKAVLILDNTVRAQSDICIYRSETLTFENKSYDPVSAAIDLISGLQILVDAAGYNGAYLLYNDSGMIQNAAEAMRKRIMTASYASLITGEEVLDKAEKIVWYFPLESTMIYPPQLGTEYTQYEAYSELTDEEVKALELPCKYARIERAVAENVEGDAGEEVLRQADQIFRVKDYYTQTATNNTVYCTIFKNGKEYKAEATLTFGISGTCGTDATFLLQMREVDLTDAGTAVPSERPTAALTLGSQVAIVPKFFDYNNNDITEEYLTSHIVTYKWHSQGDKGVEYVSPASGSADRHAIVRTASGVGIEKCKYYILSASVYWSIVKYEKDEFGKVIIDELTGQPKINEDSTDLETRDVQLQTFITIPVRTSEEFTQAVGPTQIIYNKDGANPTYYDAPFVLYKDGEECEASWMSSCKEYLDSGSDSASRDSRILNYYPALNEEGRLTAPNMYMMDGKPYAVEAISGGNVVWTQPILIIKNKYASAMLNAWDGELCIDQENGTIMATMVGAGKKESDNTFSGVLMGDVAGGAGFDERNHKGLGLYGFNHGEQSFGFNIDGTAFIGKAGRGRINMDGNKGTIQSGVYEKNVAGMLIDLDGEDSTSAALFAYGDGGAFELNTNASKSLLEIRSGTDKDAPILIHIGKPKDSGREFYLQSENYTEDTDGTKINLKTGKIEIYNKGTGDNPSYIRIDGDGSPYLQIHDGSSNKDIFYASTSKYHLESVNYQTGEKGCFIDLYKGEMEFRKGIIGGWNIDANKIYAGNIELRAEGSMYGGTESNPWYIDKNGNASFTTINASGGGQIGPFEFNNDALFIGSNSFQGTSVYLGVSGVSVGNTAFSASSDGNVIIAGTLTVKGKSYLQGGLEVSGSSSSGGGGGGSIYSGGGGFYNFAGDSAHIGPWHITEDEIYTDTGSHLGAKGTITLANESSSLSFDDSSMLIEMGDGSSIQLKTGAVEINGSDEAQIKLYSSYLNIKSGNGRIWLGNYTDSVISDDRGELKFGSTVSLLNEGKGGIKISGTTVLDLTDDALVLDTNYKGVSADNFSLKDALKGSGQIKVYKGLICEADSGSSVGTKYEFDADLEVSGHISAYPPDGSSLTPLGKLAFLDKVVISDSTFKLGSSAITMSKATSGDTVTFTGSIPVSKQTYYLRGSQVTGLYTREWNSTTKEYEYNYYGSAYTSGGSVTVNTVDSTSLSVSITVEAQKEST